MWEHFAAAKTHFDEYTLFGVFFVGSASRELFWPIWPPLRRSRPLLALDALGNGLIAACGLSTASGDCR